MSPSLHVCRICGKKFATPKGVYGHQRIHSGSQRIWGFKESRVFSTSASAKSTSIESESLDPLRRGYKATSSLSLKESSSFMTETEEHEMIEAAMSLVMLSERVVVIRNLPPGGVAMDLELKPMQETIIGCVESKQEYSEVMGFEKSTTCSDVVAQALPSPVRSNLQTKPQSNFSYRFKICGKSFGRSQALSGHQTLHGSIREIMVRKRTFEHGDSLSGSPEAKKIVSQPSSFEISLQEELTECRDTNAKGHCVESEQHFSEVFSHSGVKKSSTCGDVIAQALPSPLRSNLQNKPESNSSYKCKICGKSLGCYQALGGHQRVHRYIRGQLARGKENFEGGNSLSVLTDSGAKKLVPKPSCFEVSQEDLIELRDTNVKEHCVESKQEFSGVFSHSGFEKSGTCSDVSGQALPSPLRSKSQTKPQSNSSYNCKICGKSFVCSQALGDHQKLHRSMRYKLAHKRRTLEGGYSLSGSSSFEEPQGTFSAGFVFSVSKSSGQSFLNVT